MIESINLFNDYYKTNYNFNWNILHPIFEEMVNFPKQDVLENEETITSYYNNKTPLQLDELKGFYDFITPIYKDILINKWGYPSENEYVMEGGSWVSKYGQGGFINPHEHTKVIAVICAYVKLPQNSSNIMFRDPYYTTKNKISTIDDKWLWKEVNCKTNDVLIFHGGCFHKTEPNYGDGDRWVITTNITVKRNLSKII